MAAATARKSAARRSASSCSRTLAVGPTGMSINTCVAPEVFFLARIEATSCAPVSICIGRSTVIPQTQKAGRTLFETHATHKVTQEYRTLAEEIEERLARLEAAADLKRAANG